MIARFVDRHGATVLEMARPPAAKIEVPVFLGLGVSVLYRSRLFVFEAVVAGIAIYRETTTWFDPANPPQSEAFAMYPDTRLRIPERL